MTDTSVASTTYHGPTSHTGSLITVRANGKTRTFPYDYSATNAHEAATQKHVGHTNLTYLGETRSGRGNRYLLTPASDDSLTTPSPGR